MVNPTHVRVPDLSVPVATGLPGPLSFARVRICRVHFYVLVSEEVLVYLHKKHIHKTLIMV